MEACVRMEVAMCETSEETIVDLVDGRINTHERQGEVRTRAAPVKLFSCFVPWPGEASVRDRAWLGQQGGYLSGKSADPQSRSRRASRTVVYR